MNPSSPKRPNKNCKLLCLPHCSWKIGYMEKFQDKNHQWSKKKKRIARKLLKNTPRLVRISCLCWLKQKQIFLKVSDLKHSRTSDVKLGIKQWPWKCEGLGLICCFRTVRDAEINWTISSVIYIKPWPEPNWNAVA